MTSGLTKFGTKLAQSRQVCVGDAAGSIAAVAFEMRPLSLMLQHQLGSR
jgi:hypothetical protein